MSGRPTEPPEVRAERLRIVLAVCGGMPNLDPREAAHLGLVALSPAEVALMDAAGEEELALVTACLEIEAELRQRSYAAIERLTARVAETQGDLDDRIRSLPTAECRRAIGDLYELGWLD